MSLGAGDKLGPYEILAPIGAGGMREVYRTRDPRLGRDVAVKVSAERFSERFEREARAIAALNHPNICQIYDVGPNYLVMELVEGENLKGALPLERALLIAEQITAALEAAHEKGIVHRDLKPANIKITPAGAVKILDFGLAKQSPGREGEATENSPTISMGMTQAGVILGTAAYMSPEQARGEPVDKRADIWAFGVVLYEMLAGQRMYEGKTVSDVLAAVLIKEPDLSKVPPQVCKLLRRCLEKDPKKRLRDIGDAMPLLDEVAEPQAVSTGQRGARWVWPSVAAAALLAAASLAAVDWLREPPKSGMVTFTIEGPVGQRIPYAMVSPDGRQVALVAVSREGDSGLLIRSMESPALRPVPGTQGVSGPFRWSPDSRKIAFYQGGQIKTVDLGTGSAQVLLAADGVQLSDWGANGIILFSEPVDGKRQVFQVPAVGGSPRLVMPLDGTRKENAQSSPQFLPGGGRFLYYSEGMNQGTYVASLDGKFKKFVKSGFDSVYLKHPRTGKSYLMSCDGVGCQAQQFDPNAIQLIGDPAIVPLLPTLPRILNVVPAGLSFSARTLLSRSKLAWYSRDGKELEVVSEGDTFYSHELSPDNRQVAWEVLTEPSSFGDIWVKDLVRGSKLRLTSDPGWEYTQRYWPDGSKIAFMWYRAQPRRFHIAIKPANGGGSEELVLESQIRLFLDDVSPDGAYLLYDQDGPQSTLWVLPMAGDRKPVLYRSSQGNSRDGRFSPDGRWVAYTSSDSGRQEIQVQDFVPEAGAAQRTHGALTVVSTDGGRSPRWSRDGKELFYLAPDNTLMAVAVKTGSQFTAGRPEKLFRLPGLASEYRIPYAAAADSCRFLLAVSEGGDTEDSLVIVTNWMESLEKE